VRPAQGRGSNVNIVHMGAAKEINIGPWGGINLSYHGGAPPLKVIHRGTGKNAGNRSDY